jgi:hypothetical protein
MTRKSVHLELSRIGIVHRITALQWQIDSIHANHCWNTVDAVHVVRQYVWSRLRSAGFDRGRLVVIVIVKLLTVVTLSLVSMTMQ